MSTRDDDRKRESSAEGGDPGAPDTSGEKNEKVLHARIPGSLDREIKRRARGLGMSVSTVVRNVLLHTFDLVEDIVTDSANIALSIAGDEAATPTTTPRGRRTSEEQDPHAGHDPVVLGWQEAVLNVNAVCGHCNTILAKGTAAAIGILETPGPRSIICTSCLAAEMTPDKDA